MSIDVEAGLTSSDGGCNNHFSQCIPAFITILKAFLIKSCKLSQIFQCSLSQRNRTESFLTYLKKDTSHFAFAFSRLNKPSTLDAYLHIMLSTSMLIPNNIHLREDFLLKHLRTAAIFQLRPYHSNVDIRENLLQIS